MKGRNPVALRIAFDLDGVLADMESALVREAVVLFGESMARRLESVEDGHGPPASAGNGPDESATEPGDPAEAADVPPLLKLNMSARQQRRLWRHVETIDNFWETLDECEPGVVARLASIASERSWEVIFLTKRPGSAGGTAQVQTQRWLAAKGFALPSVFVVQRSRGRIAASLELDIVIDDRPDNCLDVVVDSKARAILVWRADRIHLPAATRRLGIGVVDTVSQCLDILTELDHAADQRPTVVDRVMRLLGIQEPTERQPFQSPRLDAPPPPPNSPN
jgi:hypothetical protein